MSEERMEHLKKELKAHWKATEEERKRTHTGKIYEKLNALKRIYRCPNCDVVVLKKLYFNSTHNCSCGTITHIKNLNWNLRQYKNAKS